MCLICVLSVCAKYCAFRFACASISVFSVIMLDKKRAYIYSIKEQHNKERRPPGYAGSGARPVPPGAMRCGRAGQLAGGGGRRASARRGGRRRCYSAGRGGGRDGGGWCGGEVEGGRREDCCGQFESVCARLCVWLHPPRPLASGPWPVHPLHWAPTPPPAHAQAHSSAMVAWTPPLFLPPPDRFGGRPPPCDGRRPGTPPARTTPTATRTPLERER